MEPRIDSGEYIVINTLAYRFGAPARGDIVAFRHERSAPSVYLKRVIGIPGDRIAIERGYVSVNGVRLDEPYVRFRDTRSTAAVTVPPHAYYVLGDNRANSDDSRVWGFVDASDVIGRAMFAVWPPHRIGAL
jgi:signal peptidase I